MLRRFASRAFQEEALPQERKPSWFTLSFGWDETKQAMRRPARDLSENLKRIEPLEGLRLPGRKPYTRFLFLEKPPIFFGVEL